MTKAFELAFNRGHISKVNVTLRGQSSQTLIYIEKLKPLVLFHSYLVTMILSQKLLNLILIMSIYQCQCRISRSNFTIHIYLISKIFSYGTANPNWMMISIDKASGHCHLTVTVLVSISLEVVSDKYWKEFSQKGISWAYEYENIGIILIIFQIRKTLLYQYLSQCWEVNLNNLTDQLEIWLVSKHVRKIYLEYLSTITRLSY